MKSFTNLFVLFCGINLAKKKSSSSSSLLLSLALMFSGSSVNLVAGGSHDPEERFTLLDKFNLIADAHFVYRYGTALGNTRRKIISGPALRKKTKGVMSKKSPYREIITAYLADSGAKALLVEGDESRGFFKEALVFSVDRASMGGATHSPNIILSKKDDDDDDDDEKHRSEYGYIDTGGGFTIDSDSPPSGGPGCHCSCEEVSDPDDAMVCGTCS